MEFMTSLDNLLDIIHRKVWQAGNALILVNALKLARRATRLSESIYQLLKDWDVRDGDDTSLVDPFEKNLRARNRRSCLLLHASTNHINDRVNRSTALPNKRSESTIGGHNNVVLMAELDDGVTVVSNVRMILDLHTSNEHTRIMRQ
jgi:hypothetical protein